MSATPADLFGELFDQVQRRDILGDGKLFADAIAKRHPSRIMADYRVAGRLDDRALRRFVAQHFDVPDDPPAPAFDPSRLPMRDHIRSQWPKLTRPAITPRDHDSALAVPGRHVVPGGRFRELYYWDSYFTMLGLLRDGHGDLVESMIHIFTGLIERFGHIPNGTRSYYLSRSQPPVYALMVGLSRNRDVSVSRRRLAAMIREHAFWMRGAADLPPGESHARAVRLPGGALLNRYWDDRTTPRDESWREDIATASLGDRPAGQVYRDLRAAAESGWDFSSRWLADPAKLASIRTTAIVPIDLNCLLLALEAAIARNAAALEEHERARVFDEAARARRSAIDTHLWSEAAQGYADHDLKAGERRSGVTAATLFPLFVGAANADQAAAVAGLVDRQLLAAGGLRTTLVESGQQWDAPNGWAPLQWVAVVALRRYGFTKLAAEIAARWLETVERHYRTSGRMFEKYDVERGGIGVGGEYRVQDGFGWTNGVTAALMDR